MITAKRWFGAPGFVFVSVVRGSEGGLTSGFRVLAGDVYLGLIALGGSAAVNNELHGPRRCGVNRCGAGGKTEAQEAGFAPRSAARLRGLPDQIWHRNRRACLLV